MKSNIFDHMPKSLPEEVFEDLLTHESIRIERILSHGQTSPDQGWYDQDEHEWVMVLKGEGHVQFEEGKAEKLKPGDFINIPAHIKHRVIWTDPDQVTVWLAVFYPKE